MEEETKQVNFNMAVATLARLDAILRRMELASLFCSSDLSEQRMTIKLAKHFFLNATPLMEKKLHDKYKKEILDMKTSTKTIKGRRVEFFDSGLEKRILEILMDIEIELKEHFMPTRVDDE